MNAITAFGTAYMGGEKGWFVTDPTGRMVRREGKGFVQFDLESEAKAFAARLESGDVRLNKDGRVPAGALGPEK